jgi:hypothetical protein
MKTNIPNRDWELLSEYLDQELGSAKQSKLELRIRQEPELRAALEDLRRTRFLLRSAPRMKAPRNFTLKPHMVPQRQPRRIYPFFQLASAMATALLLLVFVGEFFTMGLGTPEPQVASAPEPMQALEAFAVEEAVEGESRDLAPGAVGEKSPPPDLSPAPSIAAVPESDVPPAEPGEGMRLLAEPEILDPEIIEPDETLVGSEPTLDTAAYGADTFLGLTLWRLLQVSLALIAVGAGLAALYFRRIG